MANYKLVNADQLDADLSGIANSIRNKGGTSASMSFPDGFSSAINAISTGVTVQRKSGTFTTNASGTATVNCGFKPDAVFFTGTDSMANNRAVHSGAAFTEKNVTSTTTFYPASSTSYILTILTVGQVSNGFTVSGVRISTSGQQSNENNRSIPYIAIKYTE